jgi:ribonuclease G
VHLKSGGYIVIDETEALVAIDVNTGRHKGGKDQEALILKVNLEAAEEICRQLRLRNMGGLIVLDFIDMKSGRDRQQVYTDARRPAPRQGQDPHPAHLAARPHGNDPPAPQRKRPRRRL